MVYLNNSPIVGIDADTEDFALANTDARDIVNIRNTYRDEEHKGKTSGPVKGNLLCAFNLGTARYKELGSCEDKQSKLLYYFIYASDDKHKILVWDKNATSITNPQGTIQLVQEFNWGWTPETNIHDAQIVNSELLYWIDPVPHKINVKKANNNGKFKTWNVLLPVNYTSIDTSFQITVKNIITGAGIAAQQINLQAGQTIAQAFHSIATQINAGNLNRYITAEACDCSMTITEKKANSYNVVFFLPAFEVIPMNWYGLNIIARYFDDAKWAPGDNPEYTYIRDATKNYNFVENNVWQFRLGIEYDDGEESKLSPISPIAVNNQICNEGVRREFNVCDIRFQNPDLVDPNVLVIIKRVGVYVRKRNDGTWRKIKSLEPCEYLFKDNTGASYGAFEFDGLGETSSVSTTQATLLYDRMPREADSLVIVENRKVFGGVLDDYNAPDCAELDLSLEYGTIKQPEYFDIILNLRVCNPSADGVYSVANMPYMVVNSIKFVDSTNISDFCKRGGMFRNPGDEYPSWGGIAKDFESRMQIGFGQGAPEGGFLVYLAGTNLFGFTKQVIIGGSLELDEFGAMLTEGTKMQYIQNFYAAGGDVYHQVTIKRVPKGKYVVRVANSLCSFGDEKAKAGRIFNVDNNLYHLTSTNTFRFNDPAGNWIGDTEALINVTADGNYGEIWVADVMIPNFNNLNVARSMVGYLIDQDLLNVPGQIVKCLGIEKQTVIMTFSGPWSETYGILQGYDSGTATYTDHNGYFFFTFFSGAFQNRTWLSVVGANNAVVSHGTDDKYLGSIGKLFDSIMLEVTKPKYSTTKGVTGSFNLHTPINLNAFNILGQSIIQQSGAIDITQVVRQVIILALPFYRQQYSTVLYGRVVDGNTDPICCCPAVYRYTGRPGITGDDGIFAIVVFADGRHPVIWAINGKRGIYPVDLKGSLYNLRGDHLILTTGDCPVEFTNDEFNTLITPFGPNPGPLGPPYSPDAWYNMGDLTAALFVAGFIKAAKRAGKYGFAFRFKDDLGRRCTCVEAPSLYIPFFTENQIDGYPIINWSIPADFKPPKWATRVDIMRTRNQVSDDWLQWIVNDVKYVITVDASAQPVETTYENFQATQVWISVVNIFEYAKQNPDSTVGLPTFKKGQRIRFSHDGTGALLDQFWDLEVTGFDETGWLKLKFLFSIGQLKTGFRFEVLNQKPVETDAKYFEMGECYPCTNPGHDNNDFSVRSGVFTWGDTYWVKRLIPIRDNTDEAFRANLIFFMESSSISDFYLSKDEDIGLIGDVDHNFKEVYRNTMMRVSDKYFPGSSAANGLSTFNNIDDKELDRVFGGIKKLIVSGYILISVHENGRCVTHYLGRAISRSGENDVLQALGGGFLGDTRALVGQGGTSHPESIKVYGDYVYGYNAPLGIMWRYANNGLFSISTYKMVTVFAKYARDGGVWSAQAAFDTLYEDYIVTISKRLVVNAAIDHLDLPLVRVVLTAPIAVVAGDMVEVNCSLPDGTKVSQKVLVDSVDGLFLYLSGFPAPQYTGGRTVNGVVAQIAYKGPAKTYAFNEAKNRWTTRFSFLPEGYGSVDSSLVSFDKAGLWVHDKNPLRNNFYGVQYKSTIKLIHNANQEVKLWQSIFINSKQDNGGFDWSAPVVTNKIGQLSKLDKDHFRKFEEYYSADYLRDINSANSNPDPLLNGDEMRSSSIVLELENDYTGDFDLVSINSGFVESKRNSN